MTEQKIPLFKKVNKWKKKCFTIPELFIICVWSWYCLLENLQKEISTNLLAKTKLVGRLDCLSFKYNQKDSQKNKLPQGCLLHLWRHFQSMGSDQWRDGTSYHTKGFALAFHKGHEVLFSWHGFHFHHFESTWHCRAKNLWIQQQNL